MSADNVVGLVKGLSEGRCFCYYINGSASLSTYDPMTGKVTQGHYDPGTKVTCLRCRARAALEADGIEYEKVDHVPEIWRI